MLIKITVLIQSVSYHTFISNMVQRFKRKKDGQRFERKEIQRFEREEIQRFEREEIQRFERVTGHVINDITILICLYIKTYLMSF